jgi:hypothetical protein
MTAEEHGPAPEPILDVTCRRGSPSCADAWDSAVARSRDTWLYHQSRIVSLFVTPEAEPPIFVECRREGELLGGAILSVTTSRWHGIVPRQTMRGSFGPAWTSPFVVEGLAPRVSEAVFERVVEGCKAAALEQHCEEILLSDCNLSRRVIEDRPLVNRYVSSVDWKHFASYYWLLGLSRDEETLWRNVAPSQRTHIRRAREKLDVVAGTDLPGGCEALVTLMECVNRREGFEVAGREELVRIWDAIYNGRDGQVYFCLADGQPCTASGVSRLGTVASSLHGAKTDDAMNGAVALSMWAGIEWAKSVGCEWFDLNSMIPERNRQRLRAISQFKKSFGGGVVAVHGASQRLQPVRQATYTFLDAWGAAAKRLIRGRWRS